MFETIVALATPPLKSALGIIRISGDDCFNIVNKCFSKNLLEINTRTALVGEVINENKTIDQVVLIAYKGPNSFTGEDLIEIICHGSPLIENQIIEVVLKNGARLATNGEYSSRAFLHQKIDLIQAEAINDVINATTNEAKNLSLLSLEGEVSKLVKPIKTKIADIMSLIEVNIDFPEYEDIEQANKEKITAEVDWINKELDKLIADGEVGKIIVSGIKTAIVGKPNVGKSSLLNALLGEEKAIVTNIAGTTRDIVEGDINLNGIVLHLLDTAGIRESDDLVESIGVTKSKKALDEADFVICVLDNEFTKEDKEILELIKNKKHLIAYNKADLIDQKQANYIYISAKDKNIEPLIDAIHKELGITEESFKQPALSNTRQLGLLKQAKEALLKAREDAENDLTVDLIAVSLNVAYDAILEVLGETNQKDLSKEIFSRFCVGK